MTITLKMLEDIERMIDAYPGKELYAPNVSEPLFSFAGLRIVESPLCEQIVPARRHKHRRNQSAAYHRRVQKKWTKRFGTKRIKVAYFINGQKLGLYGSGQSFVAVHPDTLRALRRLG